ncbi:glycosyltransferase 87 family protein [Streptomyces sp. NPDC058373]|uniref:glycosyltransferase 87 family protein n=1 Tax=Streptomyces sp. NPDC058373 TaxID=3346465 RepID=UPI00365C6EE9
MTAVPLSRLRRTFPVRATALCLVSFAAFWVAQRLAGVTMVDLMVYRAEGRAVLDGADLYALRATENDLPATYPPFAALLFTPLPLLGTGLMRTLATAGNLLLLAALALLTLRLVTDRSGGRPLPRGLTWLGGPALAALAVWSEPVWTTLRYGQINLLITVLVLWDMRYLPGGGPARGRRWAGAGIGLAAAVKLTPGLFIAFLLLTGVVAAVRGGAARPWLALARNTVLWFLGATAAAAAVLPRDSWRFWSGTFLEAERAGHPEQTANQSLRGLLGRLLHTADPGLWWLAAALLVGAAGLAVAVAAALRGRAAWAATACGVTALLVSPVSWSHHWVWCVPMAVLALSEAVRVGGRWHRAGAAALTAAFFTYSLWWVPHGVERPELHQGPAEFALSALYPLAALGFLALTLRAVRRPAGADRADVALPAQHVPRDRSEAAAGAEGAGRQAAGEAGRSGRQAVAKE